MFKFAATSVFVLAVLFNFGCENYDNLLPLSPSSIYNTNTNKGDTTNPINKTKEIAGSVFDSGPSAVMSAIPKIINGVELTSIQGWLANIYPWDYLPNQSTVHPVPRLWTPYQRPSPFQMMEQCRQIKEFGGGGAILEYNPDPSYDHNDHNYWLSNNFAADCGPFFLLYEHIYGTRFIPVNDGPKNMDNPYNRQVFKDDIRFIWESVIWDPQNGRERYPNRYITISGRAVIYLWSSAQMTGDFASLLEEVKSKYPVSFIGSGEIWSIPSSQNDVNRVQELDGFMEYTLGGRSNHLRTVRDYHRASYRWGRYLRELESKTSKRHLFIPTFQAAYDDGKASGRTNPVMYPANINEIQNHAEMIKGYMSNGIYSRAGPFVVYSELPEGAAVIESQLPPETERRLKECQPGQSQQVPGNPRMVACGYVGYGTGRLQILKDYFGF